MPLDDYTFLPEEANRWRGRKRTDWSFTWERTGFRAKDAPYRLRVTLRASASAATGVFEGARGVAARLRAAAFVERLSSRWLRSFLTRCCWARRCP